MSDLLAPVFVSTVVKGMSIVASFGFPIGGFELGSCWKPSRENRCLVDILTADVGTLWTASQLILLSQCWLRTSQRTGVLFYHRHRG